MSIFTKLIGQHVVVRAYSAGVHIGTLGEVEATPAGLVVVLHGRRRYRRQMHGVLLCVGLRQGRRGVCHWTIDARGTLVREVPDRLVQSAATGSIALHSPAPRILRKTSPQYRRAHPAGDGKVRERSGGIASAINAANMGLVKRVV